MIAVGSYWLPTNILTSCRNEIMGNIDEWRKCVESGQFIKMFGYPNAGSWEESEKGFGLSALKTCPSGFPKDYKHIEYLRSEEHTSELQSRQYLVCRLLLEKKKHIHHDLVLLLCL